MLAVQDNGNKNILAFTEPLDRLLDSFRED